MIKQVKTTMRDVISDNVEYTLSQLRKINTNWKYSHTKGAYNFYILTVQGD